MARPGPRSANLTVRGLRVGHAEDPDRTTGVTALLFDQPSPTVVDVRGGASCTYDTASLAVEATFGRRWGLFFAGGSIFGLDAARGLRTRILETGGGHRAFTNPNPIAPVSGATLFDLPARPRVIPDYLPLGYEAARSARGGAVAQGRVGAGVGATVAKYLGRARAAQGAVGIASAPVGRGRELAVLVVLNSVGAVRDPESGRWVEGARNASGRVIPPADRLSSRARGTTLIAAVTDAPADRRTLQRLAVATQTGMARTVVPTHTATDGDVVFASTTCEELGPTREAYPGAHGDALGVLAARLVGEAAIAGLNARRR